MRGSGSAEVGDGRKLRMIARTLVGAVAGCTALASLAQPIEEAVRGL
ncbi:hypothetical protein AB0D97_28645 [Streptomyces roseus]